MSFSFFLYGAYDEDQTSHSRFKEFVIKKEKAYAKGSLYTLSCGLNLMTTVGDTVIPGNLVELGGPESYLSILDSLSGYNPSSLKKSLVLRERLFVSTTEAQPVETQTYCLNTNIKIAGLRQLDTEELSGAVGQQNATLVDKLTERQKTYIQRLSQAKGREIVPVDLALYRELMSLELIVDKGRRLALSRLGSEISFFL